MIHQTKNLEFDQIVEVFHEGDMVWVHGFHLAILPAFLDRTVKVGLVQFVSSSDPSVFLMSPQ